MNDNEYYKSCDHCGRPMVYCKGQCCGKTQGCQCKEYGPKVCGAIRPGEPKCPYQAVIPSLTVESVSNLKDLADCFVHVSDINTTFYIDDKHRIMTTWAGLVSVDDYDFEANPLNLRSQIAYDTKNNKAAIYDKQGVNYIFQISDINNDYMLLEDKPQINGVTLEGDKTSADLGIPDIDEVAMVFDTVADMKQATNLADGGYAQTLGYHSIDDGGGAIYYINTTGTVDEASIIAIGDTLKAHIILLDEIIANQFGAYGDDTHDDATAIQKALDYGATVDLPVKLLINKVYKINSTLTALNDFIMDGQLHYTGTATGINIGDPDDRTTNKTFKINIISDDAVDTANSAGAKIYNLYESNIDIYHVENFYKGVQLIGINNNGFVYNKINIVNINNYYIGLELLNDVSGWVNENQFYGGRIVNLSGSTYYQAGTAIKITSGSTYLNNNNVFYAQCVEGNSVGIDFDYARLNKVYDTRCEDVTTAAKFGSTSINNYMKIGFGNATTSGMVKPNLVIDNEDFITNVYSKCIYDSGYIPSSAVHCDNGGRIGKLISYVSNTPDLRIRVNFSDGKLVTSSDSLAACYINLDATDKTVYLRQSVSDGNRLAVVSFDSEGNVISAAPQTNTGGAFSSYTSNSLSSTLYRTGANTTNDVIIQLPSTAASCIVGILNPSGNTPYSLQFYVKEKSKSYVSYPCGNPVLPVSDRIPDTEGYAGQVCLCNNSTANGWRYNGSSWVAF